MSLSSNFPTSKPSLNLDFANTKQLDPRITFTRASTATYYGTQTAKAEQNLLLQSQDFTTTWTTTSQNATITANTTAAPDGTTTADTLTDDATSGIHRVSQSVTTSNTLQMVYSVFAKYSTMQWISISAATGTGTWAGAKFDVQNGVLGSTSQQGTGFTANSSSITAVGNGWYRCVLVYTAGASGSTTMLVSGATDGTTFTTSQRGSEVYIGSGSAVFLWGAQLEQRSAVTAYTATTTQPITNYIPVLLTAASGVPRFDHNPTTFESLGLLIEESRTNLLTYSAQFDNAAWTKTDSTITANTVIAPDGTLTGDKLVENTATALHFTLQTVSLTNGTAFTASVYVKAGERTFTRIRLGDSGFIFSAVVNLTTGLVDSTSGTGSVVVTPVGNNWYRVACTGTVVAGNIASLGVYLRTDASTESYTGNGYSGIYIWGAQLEAGGFATSYIPTVAATVTRAADVASMTGTNFSSWYNQAQGTIYLDYQTSTNATGSVSRLFSVNDNSANNSHEVFGTLNTRAVMTSANASQADSGDILTNSGSGAKIIYSYQTNDWGYCVKAGSVATDTSCVVPVVSQLNIFDRAAGDRKSTGTIRKIAYYPLRVTNAQLQALTS